MSNGRHYPNAPITEAVLDLRVASRADINAEELSRVIAGDEVAYPTAEPVTAIQGALMFGPQASTASTVRTQIGFVFRRKDGRYIYQARTDGFTISQMRPYSEWKEFRAEARERWQRYRDVARPTGIIRAALRYVNRIDVQEPLVKIENYLRTHPHISAALPQSMQGYFLQLALPFPNIQSLAMITETIIPPAKPGVVSLVLDIDTFREYSTPASEDEVWPFLEELRKLKNEVFEACITDKARELFR